MEQQLLKWSLRIIGLSSVTATIFVFAPYSWMNEIHQAMGLGGLPSTPVVGYLARSTSAFYAIMGGLFLLLSMDTEKHREVIRYIGAVFAVFGVVLFWIGWVEGLPLAWRYWEGPFMTVVGFLIFRWARPA